MTTPVTFASLRIESEWDDQRLAPLLRQIAEEFCEWASSELGWIPCVTSIWRSVQENALAEAKTQIHCFWRAIDFRTKDRPESDVVTATRWINERWVYDASRPDLPVAYSAPHGTGLHLHLQVHSATVLRAPLTEVA